MLRCHACRQDTRRAEALCRRCAATSDDGAACAKWLPPLSAAVAERSTSRRDDTPPEAFLMMASHARPLRKRAYEAAFMMFVARHRPLSSATQMPVMRVVFMRDAATRHAGRAPIKGCRHLSSSAFSARHAPLFPARWR